MFRRDEKKYFCQKFPIKQMLIHVGHPELKLRVLPKKRLSLSSEIKPGKFRKIIQPLLHPSSLLQVTALLQSMGILPQSKQHFAQMWTCIRDYIAPIIRTRESMRKNPIKIFQPICPALTLFSPSKYKTHCFVL